VIADTVLHIVARLAVRAYPPLTAKRIVDAFGGMLPSLTIDSAARVASRLDGRGTCLTRALAISSRVPGSEVVLGTDGSKDGAFYAHAWVEYRGEIVAGGPRARRELTRLGGKPPGATH
jgi:hypothetical protein